MKQIDIPIDITCSTDIITPVVIDPFECIGDSLTKINNNYSLLHNNDKKLCSSLASTINVVENIVIPPIGAVVAWYGVVCDANDVSLDGSTITENVSAFPRHNGGPDFNWIVCTGVAAKGISTPNLIGRFIVGAGNPPASRTFNDPGIDKFNLGDTGGAQSIALNAATIPKLSTGNITGTATSTAKFVNKVTDSDTKVGSGTEKSVIKSVGDKTGFVNSTFSIQGNIGNDNPSSFTNLPPYTSLYYIIRIS